MVIELESLQAKMKCKSGFFFSSWFGFGRSFILNGVEEMTEVGNGEQEEEEGSPIALAQLAARSLPLPSPALPVQFALTALIMSITPVTPRGGGEIKEETAEVHVRNCNDKPVV